MIFNRWDICQAYYDFARDYHRGQWSKEYAILSRLSKLKFQPSAYSSRRSGNCEEIYQNLVKRHTK